MVHSCWAVAFHLRELEIPVANSQRWSAGEHQVNVENLGWQRFQIEELHNKLRQQPLGSLFNANRREESRTALPRHA